MGLDKLGSPGSELRPQEQKGKSKGGINITRIRMILEDDDGQEINRERAQVYELRLKANRLRDIKAAVEQFKQEALPELEVELLTRAQAGFVAEEKRGVLTCNGKRSIRCTGRFQQFPLSPKRKPRACRLCALLSQIAH